MTDPRVRQIFKSPKFPEHRDLTIFIGFGLILTKIMILGHFSQNIGYGNRNVIDFTEEITSVLENGQFLRI